MFVSSAFAQDAGAAAGPTGLEAFIPLILIVVVFYFLLIRPQQKKMKEHKAMLGAIRRGDRVALMLPTGPGRVVTGGGIIGTVTKVVDDTEVAIEIADGVRVRVQRSLISTVLSKTEPVKEQKTQDTKGGEGGSGGGEGGAAKLKKLLGGK